MPRQWRVDAPASDELDKAVMDAMVAELAVRMFNDLTLRGSVRWRAIRAFTEHLDLYWESHRTPRDRAIKLERAEGKLLEAIAEDERFDLAFYNLGVVYSQLADTERAAAERSDYVKPERPPADRLPRRGSTPRWWPSTAPSSSTATGPRPSTRSPSTSSRAASPDDRDALRGDRLPLRARARARARPRAQAHELKGDGADRARRERRIRACALAVGQSWRRLWRVEFRERSAPPTADSLLPGARANLAAALGTLAKFNFDQADGSARRLKRADRLFEQACALAVGDTQGGALLAHGRTLEQTRGRAQAADRPLPHGAQDRPREPGLLGASRRALAAAPRGRASGEDAANVRRRSASNELAPIYRRTLEPHPPKSRDARCATHTLEALRRIYERARGPRRQLAHRRASARSPTELEAATRERDAGRPARDSRRATAPTAPGSASRSRSRSPARSGGSMTWPEAADGVPRADRRCSSSERPDGLVQHSLRAKHAARAAQAGHELEKALVDRRRPASSRTRSAPCARREVGKAHFALLQFEQALSAWQQTLWLTPNDPYLHWRVAFCHWQVAQDRHDERPARRR